jgi:hypothetical protein
MRARVFVLLLGFFALSLALLSMPRPAYAIQTHVNKVSGACGSISAEVTLLHISDDGGAEDKYWFRIFEGETAVELVHVEESLARAESPFYWQTGPFAVSSANGLYRSSWMSKPMARRGPIETVFYQCLTGASWRPNESYPQDPDIPDITCHVQVPVWSTNGAPEPGALIAIWSYGRSQTDDEFFVDSMHLNRGARLRLGNPGLTAPCGVYVRPHFQPDDTKELIYLNHVPSARQLRHA